MRQKRRDLLERYSISLSVAIGTYAYMQSVMLGPSALVPSRLQPLLWSPALDGNVNLPTTPPTHCARFCFPRSLTLDAPVWNTLFRCRLIRATQSRQPRGLVSGKGIRLSAGEFYNADFRVRVGDGLRSEEGYALRCVGYGMV